MAPVIDAQLVAARVQQLRDEVAPLARGSVAVVAVTKTFGADAVLAALDAGADAIGENYAQELALKAEAVARAAPARAPVWHFIGRLQRNKVRTLAPIVALWQTVDRVELVRELATRAPGASILVQVNATGEPQKGGCPPAAARALVDEGRAHALDVRGLMTVGAGGDAAATRRAFREVRALADELELADCSMGMSDDYLIAVQEGATIIRVGSLLFGPRQI